MMELESVWSGQRGVYVGSCLREMESYATRVPDPRDAEPVAPSEFEGLTMRQAVIRAFELCGTLTRMGLFETVQRPYTTVSGALDRLCREGLIEDTGDVYLCTNGRPAKVFRLTEQA